LHAKQNQQIAWTATKRARQIFLARKKPRLSHIHICDQLKSCQFTLSRNAPPDFCKYKHRVSTSSKQETGSKQHLLVMIVYVLL